MLSLNQIIKAGNNFASAHYMLNDFGSGPIEDFATSGVTSYPAMWMDVEPATLTGGRFQTVCRVYIMDRLLKGHGNLIDALSDTERTALDLVAHFCSPTYFPQTQTILDKSSITFNPLLDPFHDDEIAGWYFDLTFVSEFLEDRCQIPFNSTIPTPINPNSMNFSDQETPTGTIDGINTVFTTLYTPIAMSVYVYYNGQLLTKTSDYTVSNNSITMGIAPEIGSILRISYRY